MREKEINLMDLVIEILLRWRMLVIWMLAGAVLLGTFNFVQSFRTYKAQAYKVESAKQQLEQELQEAEQMAQEENAPEAISALERWFKERLTDAQMRNVNYVITYEKLYNDKLAYQEQSILMQIDPNNVSRAELTFYVTADDRQRSYDIEKVYEDIARSGEAYEYIAEKIGSETVNVNEAFSLGRGSSGLLEGTDTFKIVIIHYDENVCQNMAQAMVSFMESKHDELVEKLGSHEVMLLNQSFAVVTDTNVMSHQRSYMSDLASLEAAVVDYKGRFTNIEWQYYDFLLNGELTELSEENMKDEDGTTETPEGASGEESLVDIINRGVTVKPRVSVKYIILGAILAAFVYVFYVFMKYVLNTKLRFTDDMQEIYNIPQLGTIPNHVSSKKPFAFVDDWILSLRDRNKRKFTKEEALELATVAAKMAVRKEGFTFVSLVGCDLKERSLVVCEEIKKNFDSDNIRINILNNVLYDAQVMAELEGTQGVILVERVGSTLYSEIVQELELLKRQGIKVLGGIVVE